MWKSLRKHLKEVKYFYISIKHRMWKWTYYVCIITLWKHAIWLHWKISQQNLLIDQAPFMRFVYKLMLLWRQNIRQQYANIPCGIMVHVSAWTLAFCHCSEVKIESCTDSTLKKKRRFWIYQVSFLKQHLFYQQQQQI